jgi:hypothetical protein
MPAHFNKPEAVRLADDQFDKLVELLTPGYQAAQLCLQQMAEKSADVPAVVEPVAPVGTDANGTD